MRKRIAKLSIVALALFSVFGAGWTWDDRGVAHGATHSDMNDPGDGGGCSIGQTANWGGHAFICINFLGSGVGVWVQTS
jgi:hypothetical protein